METKKIVFPTDFSTLSDAVLDHATTLAREHGAKLIIVHVEEPPAAYGGGEMYYGIPEPDMAELEQMLNKVTPRDPQVSFERRLATGDPASEIVRLAEEEGADMIVMATHGRTGLSRLVMGSVAEAVVRHARCPVMTFKTPDKQAVKS